MGIFCGVSPWKGMQPKRRTKTVFVSIIDLKMLKLALVLPLILKHEVQCYIYISHMTNYFDIC